MPRFRPARSADPPGPPPELLDVGQMIEAVLLPGHFFVAAPLALAWQAARTEQIPWEIFRGTLLEPAQTRQSRTFLAWHIRAADGPVLSVRLDVPARQLHVTRGLQIHGWEAYDAGEGAIHSREVPRWTQELIGTIALDDFPQLDDLRDELICLLWQAVVGTSRLPLASIEAPLPAFALGQLAYVYRAGLDDDRLQAPIASVEELIEQSLQPDLGEREQAKLLEIVLRASTPAEAPTVARCFLQRRRTLGRDAAEVPRLLRRLFNEVSLSPYTSFVDTCLAWVRAALTTEDEIDFLAHLLRQLGRHLAAYDLMLFHHRGANYPDALLLDAVLRRYLDLIETRPELFATAPLRRRALRQGCLLRRQYEGHLVPDVPTSPGENARVVPGYPHLSEEQLLQPSRRRRQLFADAPTMGLLGPQARAVLQQSIADLAEPAERTELGLGLFIDRPLGYAKRVGEPDQTPLLAHLAYSETLAQRRLRVLAQICEEIGLPPPVTTLAAVTGLPHTVLAEPARPIAALTDVRRVADDFIIVRTLPGGVTALWEALGLAMELPRLVVQVARPDGMTLTCYDEDLQPCLQGEVDVSRGYARRAGIEVPVAGLRVLS